MAKLPFGNLRRRQSGTLNLQAIGHEIAEADQLQTTTASYEDGRGSVAAGQLDSLASQTEAKQRRFSRLRLRHASDPELSNHFRAQAEPEYEGIDPTDFEPSIAAPSPVVSYTSPKREQADEAAGGFRPWPRRQSYRAKSTQNLQANIAPAKPRKSISDRIFGESSSPRPSMSQVEGTTHSLSARSRSSLVLPVHRFSSSSTSEEPLYAATTTAHSNTSSTTTTFFKIPRKKKAKQESLFPLPAHLLPSAQQISGATYTSNTPSSTGSVSPSKSLATSPRHSSHERPFPTPEQPHHAVQSLSAGNVPVLRIPMPNAQTATSFSDFSKPGIVRRDSTASAPSSSNMRASIGRHLRKRSGTYDGPIIRSSEDDIPSVPPLPSGRTSVASTNFGRNSIGGLKSLTSRLRHPSDAPSPGDGSPGGFSLLQNSSFGHSKETLLLPDREEGETAGKYYSRLETTMPKRALAIVLSKSNDSFNHDVLRSLMRSFKLYEVPLDIAIRQFLWEIDLPGEAQQIDRVVSAFAERCYECNPHIFQNFDQVYLIAYSLIILHSDLFNKNNKRKMQKSEYQKNTGGHGIDDEILGYFYDNIQHAEFIAQDPVDAGLDTRQTSRSRPSRSSSSRGGLNDNSRANKADPYNYILDPDVKWETLRPPLKSALHLDDIFTFMGTVDSFDMPHLRDAFSHYGTLEIVSARSRPDAFADDPTRQNPLEASPGLVAIRVVKVGLLWRKESKRRKTQRPWQQWGAVLTPSRLYFFRNTGWIKTLITQFDAHEKSGNPRLIFAPPLDEFKPDHTVPIQGVVALLDKSYDKHKNAFVLAKDEKPPSEEVLLADNEIEMNDWLAKINYGAAFHWDTSTHSPEWHDHNAQVRSIVISARLTSVEGKHEVADEKLQEILRNARHLQILVPWSPKTRSELLTYASLIGVRVRYSRFTEQRLRCEMDMLKDALGLKPNTNTAKMPGSPPVINPRTTSKAGTLSRWNSKAGSLVNVQRSKLLKTSSPVTPSFAAKTHTKEADVEESNHMSHLGTSSQAEPSAENSWMGFLPTLRIGSGTFSISSDHVSDRLAEPNPTPNDGEIPNEPKNVHTPSSVVLSRKHEIHRKEIPNRSITPSSMDIHPSRSNDLPQTPSSMIETADYPEFLSVIPGSPDSRKHRRSMPRTLRESKELYGTQQPRSRKGRDSSTSIGANDPTMLAPTEGIKRSSGSFTLHGKKASVITLSPEWQQVSAEERLKQLRKEAGGEEIKPLDISGRPSGHETSGAKRYSSTASESNRTSYHSVFEDVSPYGSDVAAIDYPAPQSLDPITHINPHSTRYGRQNSDGLTTSDTNRFLNHLEDIPREARSGSQSEYPFAVKTFLEDASTADDSEDLHERVGIALGGH